MTEVQTQTSSTKRTVGLIVAAVVLIGGVVFGAVQLSGGGDSTVPSGTTNQSDEGDDVQVGTLGLPEAMGGQEAIDALGDSLDGVAARNNMTADELKDLLLRNPSAQISKTGIIMFVDPGPQK